MQSICSFDNLIWHKLEHKCNKNGIFCAISIVVEHFGNQCFNQWRWEDYNSLILVSCSGMVLHEKEGVQWLMSAPVVHMLIFANFRHIQNVQLSLNINIFVNFLAIYNCNISKSKFVFRLSSGVILVIIASFI